MAQIVTGRDTVEELLVVQWKLCSKGCHFSEVSSTKEGMCQMEKKISFIYETKIEVNKLFGPAAQQTDRLGGWSLELRWERRLRMTVLEMGSQHTNVGHSLLADGAHVCDTSFFDLLTLKMKGERRRE